MTFWRTFCCKKYLTDGSCQSFKVIAALIAVKLIFRSISALHLSREETRRRLERAFSNEASMTRAMLPTFAKLKCLWTTIGIKSFSHICRSGVQCRFSGLRRPRNSLRWPLRRPSRTSLPLRNISMILSGDTVGYMFLTCSASRNRMRINYLSAWLISLSRETTRTSNFTTMIFIGS